MIDLLLLAGSLGFVLLSTTAVWHGTRQRPGTTDELRILAAALAAVLILGGLGVLWAQPAGAHPGPELDEWRADWSHRLETQGMTVPLAHEYVTVVARHPYHFHPDRRPPAPAPRPTTTRRARRVTVPAGVEQWRPLVSAYFPAGQTDRALCVMWHESRGNPAAENPTSTATGLFQILAGLWGPHFGVTATDLHDPDLNTRLAARIYQSQGWTAWAPYQRGLCR